MFTRKKKALIISIYIISFFLIFSVWGENGLLSRKMLRDEHVMLQEKEEMKKADISMLRSELDNEMNVRGQADGELVFSFSDDPMRQAEGNTALPDSTGLHTLSAFAVFLLSFIPSSAAIVVLALIDVFGGRKKR